MSDALIILLFSISVATSFSLSLNYFRRAIINLKAVYGSNYGYLVKAYLYLSIEVSYLYISFKTKNNFLSVISLIL